MIVEDDPMVASVNETYLSRLPGFCVIAKAADGLQALEKIKALSGSVDLVLLDVFMPKMDGLSFLEHLKNLAPSVSVIMITASQKVCVLRSLTASPTTSSNPSPSSASRRRCSPSPNAGGCSMKPKTSTSPTLTTFFTAAPRRSSFPRALMRTPWKKSSLRSMLHQRPFPLRKLQTTWDSLEFPYANIFLISKKTTVFRVNFHTAGKDGP